jgi:ribosomal protein S17
MKRIEKKTWPELFDKVLSGEKNFDLRLAEFECEKGDILVLKEWDPKTKQYTGRELEKEITFVIKTKDIKFWSKEEMDKLGFVVMSFK